MYKTLSNIWLRILFSLMGGGMVSELIRLNRGEISSGTSSALVWLGAIVAFSTLSIIFWIMKYKPYFFPQEENEDIIDDVE